ncbi:DUF4365 domain-containing protein [Micromonospora chalcea]|uniref:DUF4365 domain-containing protein n=1 Tax=Micromonospora chalcea TaxID=1874 RepID=UPI00331E3F10
MVDELIELPTRGHTHRAEEDGVIEAHRVIHRQLRWIFREQRDDDYGVDAHIEVVSDNDQVTGKNIGAQIKSGSSWFKAVRGGWIFTESSRKHYNYWLGHSLPIIVILHHPETDNLYWQVVDQDTATETGKGFKVFVPETNLLDVSAKAALEDIARRLGPAALQVYDQSLNVLPWPTVRALNTAEQVDRTAAARLAQILAEGRGQPRFAVRQVLGARPSWLISSIAAPELWSATAGYANAHEHYDLAAEAFKRAADAGGPQTARRRALAGLTLISAERRDEAHPILETAKSAGATLLADFGLAVLKVPADRAPQVEIPPSIRDATDAQIDAEPIIVNFLAENRLRAGDLDGAIALIRRAVDGQDDRETGMRLRLAELLRRRIQERAGFGGPDSVEARRHTRIAQQQMRRWAGPSQNALAEILDLEIIDGDLSTVVQLALPAAAGGSATDREAAVPEIAYRGAMAALARQRSDALPLFRQVLQGTPYLDHLTAQELDENDASLDERIQAWRHALATADDDRGRATCILRLVDLGVWPIPEADDLLARSIAPQWTYDLAEAVARAANGDLSGALPVLRLLAKDYILAALRLVMLLEQRDGSAAAMREWQQQYRRWADVALADVLPEAAWTDDGTLSVVDDFLADSRLSGDTRMRLRRKRVHQLRRKNDWARVIRVSRAGLDERSDNYLAWSLVIALNQVNDVPAARDALTHHHPTPETEQEARLWAQLHLGLDLTDADAETAVELAEQFLTIPALAEGITSLLLREQHRRQRDDIPPWPQPLSDRLATLIATVYAGTSPETAAEDRVTSLLGQSDYQILETIRHRVQQGREPLTTLASKTRIPYGKVLLMRTAGMTLAADAEPAIASVGDTAARAALHCGEAVVDLSALYLHQLLGRDGELLHGRFSQLYITSSTARDAVRTRDSVWETTASSVVFGIRDGQLCRETIPAATRATLRALATRLERTTTQLHQHDIFPSQDPARDAIELAQRLSLPLFADDVALRQLGRARGIPAFGTTNLITVCGYSDSQVSTLVHQLAAAFVVDLPLDADTLAEIETDGKWRGPGLVNLSRSQWWTRPDSINTWRSITVHARRVSEDNLTLVTKFALQGALQDLPAGQRTQRYQQILVAALDALHESGLPAPDTYLDDLTAATAGGIAPEQRFIFRALIEALRQRGVDAPEIEAITMLPQIANNTQTWQ